jgi:hypothetical protein
MSRQALIDALHPLLDEVARLDLAAPDAAQRLQQRFPLDGEQVSALRAQVREGIAAGWLCERENEGVRFCRLLKASAATQGLSVDLVHMRSPGPGHAHPQGEVDLCFAVEGAPTFDGRPPGWTVYPPGSWHVPSVSGGVMDILYFLPGGAIEFGPRKADIG